MKTRSDQQGAILIVCLLFMLIMTVLGTSSMQRLTLGERMTANFWDENLAFQAAEAALRHGEDVVVGKEDVEDNWAGATPTVNTATDQEGENEDKAETYKGLSPDPFGSEGYKEGNFAQRTQEDWEDDVRAIEVTLDAESPLNASPRFTTHFLTWQKQDLEQNTSSVNTPYNFYYVVTAQAPGRSEATQTVLQKVVQKQCRVNCD